MKLSKQQLNEYIRLYLNDLDDYGDNQEEYLLAEQTLSKFGNLITESKQDIRSTLTEAVNKADGNTKNIYEDFLMYIQELEN